MHADKISIIGVGSPFGDDTLGWRAVAWLQDGELANRYPSIHFTFLQSDRPGALLLEQLRGSGGAIIIDAMQSGLAAGSVRQFSAAEIGKEDGLLSSHGFGVAAALALARALAQASGDNALLPEKLSILGIEMGEAGSDERWQERLAALIEQTVADWVA